MPLIYVTGNAGAGKSTLCAELKKRGYEAHDIDLDGITAWFEKKSGKKVAYPKNDEQRTRAWNEAHAFKMVRARIEQFASQANEKTIFLCGQSIHDHEVWDLFDIVIFLEVNKETLKKRLAQRPDNMFGKTSGELAAIMEVHGPFQIKHRKNGAIFVDALQPIDKVADDVIEAVGR